MFYHHDQLGSIRSVSAYNGYEVASFTYDAYGNLTHATGTYTTPFGYAGQYTDTETGLQYLRARYYDPTTGHFLTRDPIEVVTREPYGYVYGNPLNLTDPSGLWGVDIPEWVSPAAAVLGIDCFGSDCESIAEQHPEVAQGLADGAGGVLDGVTFGNGRNITSVAGVEGQVRWNSGTTAFGSVLGTAFLLPFAGSSTVVAGRALTFGSVGTVSSFASAAGNCTRSSSQSCGTGVLFTTINWGGSNALGRIASPRLGDATAVLHGYLGSQVVSSDC
jgi:RHS repeat-associated protein